MAFNIPNFLLSRILAKDKELGNIRDRILQLKPSSLLEGETKAFVFRICETVGNYFHKELELPQIKFLSYIDADYYDANTNTICMNPNCIRVSDILHEVRHFLQFQFKEMSYYKGNLAPLPRPFYYFQLHEINAYAFQHAYEYRDRFDKFNERMAVFEDFKHLFKIGAFNPKVFKIEHEYYKDYNKLFDQMDLTDKEFKRAFPDGKINEFKQNFCNQIIDVTHYETDRNFFNLKYKINDYEYESNFEIKGDKCILYGINICDDNIRICNKEEYKKACNVAFDFVSNISKIYKVNELDINPYSLNIHRKTFKEIIDNYKSKCIGVQDFLDFNKIPNPTPKEDITNEITYKLNFIVPENTKDLIDQDTILDKSETVEKVPEMLYNISINEPER